mmetsp:Transcript_19679/g.34909  ORF Transcript_19679/g.34909 Transcript_19679/m.34909 type:complete len:476 (-) Transcript_19679:119-1546(-)
MRICNFLPLVVVGVGSAAGEMADLGDMKCQNAQWKSDCHNQVMDAMLHDFAKNPDAYIGLTTRSSFTDFQAYFWNAGMYACPRPCMQQEEACVTFDAQYPCYRDALWAEKVGIANHPEWYPELGPRATMEEIAAVLYQHGQPHCPRPCDRGEDAGHRVPYEASTEFTNSEAWMTTKPDSSRSVPPSEVTASPQPAQELSTTTIAAQMASTSSSSSHETSDSSTTVDPCARSGVSYSAVDFWRSPSSMMTSSASRCRVHCRGIDGVGFYQYYGPLGLCHCVPAEYGTEKVADSSFIGGSVNCGEKPGAGSKDAAAIEKKLSDDCYEHDSGYSLTVDEPAPAIVDDSLACQKELHDADKNLEYFVYYPPTGTCRLVGKGAQKLPLMGFVSGPRHCEDVGMQFKATWGQVLDNPLSPGGMVQHLKIVAGVCAVGLLAAGVFFGTRRRLEPVRARAFRSTSRSISDYDAEGLELNYEQE